MSPELIAKLMEAFQKGAEELKNEAIILGEDDRDLAIALLTRAMSMNDIARIFGELSLEAFELPDRKEMKRADRS